MACRNSALSDITKANFVMRLILEGKQAIAESCGCRHQTVRKEVIRRGIPTRHRQVIQSLGNDVMLRLIHQAGNGIKELAVLLRVDKRWMRKEIDRREVWDPMPRRLLKNFEDEDIAEAVRAHGSVNCAAKAFGVSTPTLRAECIRRGLKGLNMIAPTAPGNRSMASVSDEEIIRYVKEEGSANAAAKRFGVLSVTIYDEINRRGLRHLVRPRATPLPV